MNFESLRWAAIQFIVLVLCISLHEFGHAWAADKRRDPLPRALGRVTLNPLAHCDKIGTFAIPALMIFLPAIFGGMPFALIGWGKPVPISLSNPKTRKADEILITLAGPGMNLLLSLVGALALGIFAGIAYGRVPAETLENSAAFGAVCSFFVMFVLMNSALAIFNLIPLPPLDGSRVLRHAVGMSDATFVKIARNAWWILLLAINLPPGNPIALRIFRPLVSGVAAFFLTISEFVADFLERIF